MSFTEGQFSAAEIDQVGRTLARLAGAARTREFDEAAGLVNEWRALHAHPLRVIRNSLNRQAPHDALLAQRLKRLPSIQAKLRRMSTLRLTQMQDIGGCRVVLARTGLAFRLAAEAIETTRHELVRFDNYIEQPRRSGYRGLHLVYSYNSEKLKQVRGLKVEVQIRSRPQHQWATAVETVGTFIGEDLKSGVGDKTWVRFFALMSSVIAQQERTPNVLGTPANQSELRDEIMACDKEIGGVYRRLEAFQTVARGLARFSGSNYWVLIELDLGVFELTVQLFRPRDWDQANEAYLERELETKGNPQIDVALVSTNNMASLRRAYPNYFADLTQFRARVRRTIS